METIFHKYCNPIVPKKKLLHLSSCAVRERIEGEVLELKLGCDDLLTAGEKIEGHVAFASARCKSTIQCVLVTGNGQGTERNDAFEHVAFVGCVMGFVVDAFVGRRGDVNSLDRYSRSESFWDLPTLPFSSSPVSLPVARPFDFHIPPQQSFKTLLI